MALNTNIALQELWRRGPSENPLFLHFLNRELNRSVGQEIPIRYFEDVVKVLAIMTSAPLYTNFANILEGSYLKSDVFKKFIEFNIFRFHGERTNIEEYLATRTPRYSFDKSRYSHLNEQDLQGINIRPALVRNFTMTKRLKNKLFALENERSNEYEFLNFNLDKTKYWEVIKSLYTHKGEEAITMSLVSNYLMGSGAKEAERLVANNIGRLLSNLYFEEIVKELDGDIPTGIDGLTLFDENARFYPQNDVYLLQACLYGCGIKISSYSIDELVEFKFSKDHRYCAFVFRSILYTLGQMVNQSDSKSKLRHRIEAVLFKSGIPQQSKINLRHLPSIIDKLIKGIEISIPDFHAFMKTLDQKSKTILIITATERESKAILHHARDKFSTDHSPRIVGETIVSYIGLLNNHKVYHAQCEAGSIGPSGAQAVATDLIEHLRPNVILMPGIAFGLQKDKQKIGDILVATYVHLYEKQKVVEGKIISRGDKAPSSSLLLNALRYVANVWDKGTIHFGVMMSGEKLVNDESLVTQLKEIEPEAIGGDMEGAGIYSAAHRKKVDWIVFKSIVDWGANKTDLHQESSASTVTELLFKVLQVLTN